MCSPHRESCVKSWDIKSGNKWNAISVSSACFFCLTSPPPSPSPAAPTGAKNCRKWMPREISVSFHYSNGLGWKFGAFRGCRGAIISRPPPRNYTGWKWKIAALRQSFRRGLFALTGIKMCMWNRILMKRCLSRDRLFFYAARKFAVGLSRVVPCCRVV